MCHQAIALHQSMQAMLPVALHRVNFQLFQLEPSENVRWLVDVALTVSPMAIMIDSACLAE